MEAGHEPANVLSAERCSTNTSNGEQYGKDCNLTNASHWMSAALMNVAHRFPDEIIVLVHIAINEGDTKSSTQLGILFTHLGEKMSEMGCDVRAV